LKHRLAQADRRHRLVNQTLFARQIAEGVLEDNLHVEISCRQPASYRSEKNDILSKASRRLALAEESSALAGSACALNINGGARRVYPGFVQLAAFTEHKYRAPENASGADHPETE